MAEGLLPPEGGREVILSLPSPAGHLSSLAAADHRLTVGPDSIPAADHVDLDGSVERVGPVQRGPLGTVMTFAEALQRREPGSACAQLEPGARVVSADGTEVSDPESVRFVLAQLTAPERRLDVCPGRTIVKDDVALCTQSWRIRAIAEGKCFERASRAHFMLRRSGGRWRIAIAAPWG